MPVVKNAATTLALFFPALLALSDAFAGPRSSACASIVPAVFAFPVPAPYGVAIRLQRFSPAGALKTP